MTSGIGSPGPLVRLFRTLGQLLLHLPTVAAWMLPLAWMLGIWLLSSIEFTVDGEPSIPRMFLANLFHSFEFGILALLCLPLASRRDDWIDLTQLATRLILLVVAVYGLVDETHQAAVGGRESSLFDVLTDVVGAFCVLKVARLLRDEDLDEGVLRWNLVGGVALCMLAAAGFATIYTLAYGTGLWIG